MKILLKLSELRINHDLIEITHFMFDHQYFDEIHRTLQPRTAFRIKIECKSKFNWLYNEIDLIHWYGFWIIPGTFVYFYLAWLMCSLRHEYWFFRFHQHTRIDPQYISSLFLPITVCKSRKSWYGLANLHFASTKNHP